MPAAAEIAKLAAAVVVATAPRPKQVPIAASRCYGCSAGWMPCTPRRWNCSDRPVVGVVVDAAVVVAMIGYYQSVVLADSLPRIDVPPVAARVAPSAAATSAVVADAGHYEPSRGGRHYYSHSPHSQHHSSANYATWATDDKINTVPDGPPPARRAGP